MKTVLLITLTLALVYIFLLRGSIAVHAQSGSPTAPTNGTIGLGSVQHSGPYSDGKYICQGSDIMKQNTDGTSSKVDACGDKGEICYAVDDQTNSQSGASCITGGSSCNQSSGSNSTATTQTQVIINSTVKNINTTTIDVTVARTPQEQQQGLSGKSSLNINEGMLFTTGNSSCGNFWMKDMQFPLDFIWINGNQIVDVTENVPNPAAGVPDADLQKISPKAPCDQVLEVNAGFVKNHGIAIGDSVTVRQNDIAQNPGQTTCNLPPTAGSTGIASCKFYRNDQTPGSSNCPPSDQGFRCDQGLDYKSPKLMSYITDVADKTGVPASVLAAIMRMESTVPQVVSATGKSYSISDYTDADIAEVESANAALSAATIDQTIGSTNKAICPRSKDAQALGLMQVLPSKALLSGQATNNANYLTQGVAWINQYQKDKHPSAITSPDNLTINDFCDIHSSLYLAASLILYKQGGTWDPNADDAYLTKVVTGYFGANDPLYVDSVTRSVNECKQAANTSDLGDCLVPNVPANGVSCGSKDNPVVSTDGTYQCGHCGVNYDTSSPQCVNFNDGTSSAIDVGYNLFDPAANDGKPIFLPKIDGHDVTYTLVHSEPKGAVEEIKGYSGTDTTNGKIYYLQLHHTQVGGIDKNKTYHSGDVGGNICQGSCNEHHVHVQLASGSNLGQGPWLDASQYFCRSRTANTHYQH